MPATYCAYKKGQRYEVKQGFTIGVLTQWKAPFTGGYDRAIPAGFRFVVAHGASAELLELPQIQSRISNGNKF
jgi:hypothetical protein